MIYSVSKIDAAVDQLDWAIRLFLDYQAYIPSITLAGAAEEILGNASTHKSAHNVLKDRLSEKLEMPKKQLLDEHLNLAKNWLKHWNNGQDKEVIELKLESEAIQYISRAIANLANYDQSQTSESPRFFAWIEEHRKDLRNGL